MATTHDNTIPQPGQIIQPPGYPVTHPTQPQGLVQRLGHRRQILDRFTLSGFNCLETSLILLISGVIATGMTVAFLIYLAIHLLGIY